MILFFISIDEFNQYAQSQKQLRLEFFYRLMRKTLQNPHGQGTTCGGKMEF